ncbi:Putative zn(2)-C6 fungal-type DNA-binding domain-containing protein [Septoria linicola]|uniref:Zn(2)-C6 fungal-type DNA-binding domain-containing protein n=1 Tax=Septoria linicola TaxID=215465 RepID=A0A9Q9AKT5_9PEZI|nr:Putative zn(2)-C6 fungal-type DNA-binding domain-containing protein [Septoria linicola]
MASVSPRKPRASKACSLCKMRKFKCDNLAPQCGNCRTYEKECTYPERGRRARPTNAVIAALREENRGLRSQLSVEPYEEVALRSASDNSQSNVSSRAVAQRTPSIGVPRPLFERNGGYRPDVSATQTNRAPASINKNATYHGPTSALYDDVPGERQAQQWLSTEREHQMSTLLFAVAAKQRQMEAVNTARGLLDFDSVDPEMGLHLLNLHWNRQHHSFLVTYRPAFLRDMACQGLYFSKILLNAIYFGSAKFSPRLELREDPDDVRTAGWQFRQRLRELLGEAMDQSKITTIQALLQMTNSLFALGDEQSAAWLYAGLAFRMIN